MLRLRCKERKEKKKGKMGGAGGPERATAHFGSSFVTEKFLSQQGSSSPVSRQGLPCHYKVLRPGDRTRPGYPSRVPRVVPPSEVPLYNP